MVIDIDKISEEEMRRTLADYDEVDVFLRSPIGDKLMDDIDQEIEEATEKLKVVDSKDQLNIQKCQDQIWRAEYLKIWFNMKLIAGRALLELGDLHDDA